MEDLAQLIYDRSPATAQDLIWVIEEWRSLLKGQEAAGRYPYDIPDGPALVHVHRERWERLKPLVEELENLVRAAP